jgi:hypothetical protein
MAELPNFPTVRDVEACYAASIPTFRVSISITGVTAQENEDEVVRSVRAALRSAGVTIKRLEVEVDYAGRHHIRGDR